MASVLSQLDGPDALLTLLLADELSPADEQAALRQIKADPALAAQLQELRERQSTVDAGLSALDAATPLPLSASAAVRQFRQAVLAQQDRQIIAPLPVAASRMRLQWWMYPSVAAALVLVSLMTWWGWHNQDAGTGGGPVVVAQAPASASPTATADNPTAAPPAPGDPSIPPAVAIALPPPTTVAPAASDGALIVADTDDLTGDAGIAGAEQQADTLQRGSDPSTITASIFLGAPGAPLE